jgi:hypothetical protein
LGSSWANDISEFKEKIHSSRILLSRSPIRNNHRTGSYQEARDVRRNGISPLWGEFPLRTSTATTGHPRATWEHSSPSSNLQLIWIIHGFCLVRWRGSLFPQETTTDRIEKEKREGKKGRRKEE